MSQRENEYHSGARDMQQKSHFNEPEGMPEFLCQHVYGNMPDMHRANVGYPEE
jgi:hypothetical protein